MDTERGKRIVLELVTERMAALGWNKSDLARTSGLDAGTVGDFLSGARWPQEKSRAAIATALGWPPGEIYRLSRGDPSVHRYRLVEGGMGQTPAEAVESQSVDRLELAGELFAYMKKWPETEAAERQLLAEAAGVLIVRSARPEGGPSIESLRELYRGRSKGSEVPSAAYGGGTAEDSRS